MNTVYALIIVYGSVILDEHGHALKHQYEPGNYSQGFTTMQSCRAEEARQVNLRKYTLHQKVYSHKCVANAVLSR